ncbi:hypothetical protein ACA29_20305 [Lederbergia galactosidilytica]|uniref:SsfX3-like N-terminal domain-containing protein n=1 Tax=Lederbergia galactosidilytica TaxID=217031 RepID=A0A0Q9Y3Q7_9BACI|nr:hypothetical protein ACA29_20305 [Lederbergia galactosidilytica]
MQQVPLSEKLFHGAVSLEKTKEFVKPWRIPFDQKDLFVPACINGQAARLHKWTSGIACRNKSDAKKQHRVY